MLMTAPAWSARVPLLIRIVGLLWIGALALRTPEDTFFVGDAGLKALQAQQFAEGRVTLALDLGEPAFAHALYEEGFFPFEKPFVYRIDGRFFSAFPVVFQAITGPFVAWFGFRGLYAWPLIGLWLCWAATDRLAAACGLGVAARATTLFLLVFCSPLSVYGGLFWEHTLAVALVMMGGATLVLQPHPSSGFAGGLLLASAAWFREETLLLTALSAVLVMAGLVRERAEREDRRGNLAALCGLTLPVMLWVAFNEFAYGSPMALRALQLGPDASPQWNLPLATARFVSLTGSYIDHFPPSILMLVGLGVAAIVRRPLPPALRAPLLVGAGFLLFVPLGVPNEGGNQWGPRYLLVLLPVTAVALGWLSQQVWVDHGRSRGIAAAVILSLVALPALYLNSWQGPQQVLANARGRAEPLRLVRADPRSIVVVSQQFASQQLSRAFQGKTFFLASTGRGLKRLAEQLATSGHREFLYLCDPVYPCPSALESLPEHATLAAGYGSSTLTLSRLGDWGRYVAYAGELSLP